MVFQVRWNRPHMSLRFEHHGALVNPTMGLRTNYTVLWDCHNAILKKQKAEKTNHKGKQTQAKQKTKQNQTKTPETQNRHCDQGQLSGKGCLVQCQSSSSSSRRQN